MDEVLKEEKNVDENKLKRDYLMMGFGIIAIILAFVATNPIWVQMRPFIFVVGIIAIIWGFFRHQK